MIVDSSAVVAILRGEPASDDLVHRILTARGVRMSAASYLETGIVIDRLRDPVLSRRFDELLDELQVEVVEVTAQQARVAREAYRDFGKGTGHPAALNYGDCFSYALAATAGEPLLYQGDDFSRTDVRPA